MFQLLGAAALDVVAAWQRLLRSKGGNVAIIFAFAAFPMLLAMGMSVDYGQAAKRRARLNAAADAAALAAVTTAMMSQTTAVATLAATNVFAAQSSGLSGISLVVPTVLVTESAATGSRVRTATVSYTATSTNAFSVLLHMASINIAGSSKASATAAANIDFYLMLDTSPSMGIAATQAGINTMVSNTSSQGGCAFACHEQNPAADNLGNPNGEDNYALARNLNVPLRIDLVSSATQNLMSTAASDESSNQAVYRMAGYTFDVATTQFMPLTSNLSLAQNEAASGINMLEVYSNNKLTASNSNSDQDTNFDTAFSTLNSAMPTPGSGSNLPGDTPQEVLFIVSDGVADESTGSGRAYTPFGTNPSWCQTIKNRGIRIAVLYTTYYPLPTNSWYNTYIAPEQASIATTAKACASTGLFFQVDTGGDISAAMTSLFQTAIATAHLTQ